MVFKSATLGFVYLGLASMFAPPSHANGGTISTVINGTSYTCTPNGSDYRYFCTCLDRGSYLDLWLHQQDQSTGEVKDIRVLQEFDKWPDDAKAAADCEAASNSSRCN